MKERKVGVKESWMKDVKKERRRVKEIENEPVERERRRVENKGDEMVVRRPRWKEVKIKYRTTVEQVTYSKGEEKLR